MTEELAFIQEIRAHPHDDVPRLIYADYLEESGDPRGELIRVQCELERLAPGDPALIVLAARERELLAQHAETWLEPLRRLGATGVSARCIHRGLIERVTIDGADFAAHGEELCRLEPALHCLQLRRPEAAFASTLPPQITALDLSATQLNAEGVRSLKLSLWAAQLEALDLQFNQLGDAGMQELAATVWPRLERLELGSNNIGSAGAEALAGCRTLGRLATLRLNVNTIGDLGARALAPFVARSQLRELDLASNGLGPSGAFVIRTHCPASLERLNLRANRIGSEFCSTLRDFAEAQGVALDIRNNAGTYGG